MVQRDQVNRFGFMINHQRLEDFLICLELTRGTVFLLPLVERRIEDEQLTTGQRLTRDF